MNQIEEIAKWQKERCLDKTGYDLDGANYRFMEEIFEMNGFEGTLAKKLATSYSMYIKQERQAMGLVPTEHQIIDACNDISVFANGDILKLGYDPVKAMDETLKEISSRKGSYNTQTKKWEKVITGEEYTADYSGCKYDRSSKA